MVTVTKKFCDVCGAESDPNAKVEGVEIQVRFLTEQTEGRPVPAYAAMKKIDVCPSCKNIWLAAIPISGTGAKGHDRFVWTSNLPKP